jgi:manganese transport protein
VKSFLQISLGIMAAAGGFLDIGDLVFGVQAGARFGYGLMWALLLGLIVIIAYSEMSGRIVATVGKPVFVVMRERFGRRLGLVILVASQLVILITCAAEIGGVALVLQLLTGWPYHLLIVLVALALAGLTWLLQVDSLERVFGFGGLLLGVIIAVALATGPHWGPVAGGLVPHLTTGNPWLYWYFAIGLISATIMPYEVYFYAAGGREEGWRPPDIPLNRFVATAGYGVGSLFAFGLIMVAAQVFLPRGVVPEYIGTSVLPVLMSFGPVLLVVALIGVLCTIAGAAVETALSGAYNISQFLGWESSKNKPPLEVKRFTAIWVTTFAVAAVFISTGIDPTTLAELAVVFSVVVMPPTYLAILLVARDHKRLGSYANGRVANTVGWLGFAVIAAVSLAAVPLMILTHMGQG